MFLLPFHVVGCSHETTDTELTGRVRLSQSRIESLLHTLHAGGVAAVLLSTCHRTELYWWGDEALEEWFVTEVLQDNPHRVQIEVRDADQAVRHLFAVAAGLRSMRLGEAEILGQVRRALGVARMIGSAEGPLNDTFERAINAARHIRHRMQLVGDQRLGARVHTLLRQHMAQRVVGPSGMPTTPRVLIVGAGQVARSVLTALSHEPLDVTIAMTSRTDTRAHDVAASFGVDAVVPWAEATRAIGDADCVVFAVHVTSPLIRAEASVPALARDIRCRLWIDLGVPAAVGRDFKAAQVTVIRLPDLDSGTAEPADRSAERAARHRGTQALQRELARYAQCAQRRLLGTRLQEIEAEAVAIATANANAPIDLVVRRVARLVFREFNRSQRSSASE